MVGEKVEKSSLLTLAVRISSRSSFTDALELFYLGRDSRIQENFQFVVLDPFFSLSLLILSSHLASLQRIFYFLFFLNSVVSLTEISE